MSTATCARCGDEAQGFATINGKRYCHTDEVYHDCYQQAQWDRWVPDFDGAA